MRDQFSMSFRLQNQQSSKRSIVRPWMVGLLVPVVGGWLWLQRPDVGVAEAHASVLVPVPASVSASVAKAPLVPLPSFQKPEIRATDRPPLKKHSTRQKLAGLSPKKQLISYAFHFEGVALLGDAPCAGARLRVQVADGSRRRVLETTTDDHGAYSATLHIKTVANESVDWSLQSMEEKFQPLELVGRHIVIPDETSVMLDQPLHLVSL
jgi:hypothetical protein